MYPVVCVVADVVFCVGDALLGSVHHGEATV